MNALITLKDVAAARRVYWWLLFAPILAVPCWGLSLSAFSQPDLISSIVAAGWPLIFYFPIFVWAFSAPPFVRAHARQGLILLALRFLLAVWAGNGDNWGVLWWNALLWFFGGLVGLIQADHGRALIGNIRARILKEPPAAGKSDAPGSVEYYLEIFRSGNPSAREEAARRLKALGQLETF